MSMDIDSYIEQKKFLYGNLLMFIEDNEANNEDNLQVLIEIIKPHELSQVLKIISSISDNHHRDELFFEKIEKILFSLKDKIKQTYSNLKIYQIFRRNPRIILYLITNEIIIFDETINTAILNEDDQNGIQYCHFFLPEIKTFTDEETFKKIEGQLTKEELEEYDKKRLLGENDSYICELIRNDSIDEFVAYLNRRNLSHSAIIKPSIFETNTFLKQNQPSLIEYAAFFGSIQIFNYLLFNRVELTSNLWLYTIHSKNAELIHLLESNQIQPPYGSYELCLIESIKCHHNEIGKYFELKEAIKLTEKIVESSFKSYNYEYIPVEMKKNHMLFYLCQYEYSKLINIWLNEKKEEIEDYMNKNTSFFKRIFNISNDSNLKLKAVEDNRLDVIYYLLLKSSCINKYEFKDNKDLKKIIIPSSVKSIEEGAFGYCSSLVKILIPPSVTYIGNNAFEQCLLLTEVSIPHSVTQINAEAFSECNALKQISIPSSVTKINSMAFYKCSSLTKVSFKMPSSLTSIGDFAFASCMLLDQISIPSSVTSIGKYTFSGCLKLKQITIPSSVKSIEENAFIYCTSLTQVSFEIPSSITCFDQYVFTRCFYLTQITIPSSVTCIESYAFSFCISLEEITIPSSVISIGDFAFEKCSSLIQISIPSSVTTIGKGAFADCSDLNQILIPSSITSIRFRTFFNCVSLTQISIPSSVTNIDHCAFEECTSLIQIIIPSTITEIKFRTFYKCSSLAHISIPSSVTNIGHCAFEECTSLTQIIIPPSVLTIGESAFKRCTSLASVSIPATTKTCENAFDGCILLQNFQQNNDNCLIS